MLFDIIQNCSQITKQTCSSFLSFAALRKLLRVIHQICGKQVQISLYRKLPPYILPSFQQQRPDL